ncbi:MAG: efflux RND transporter periplasmic adaptor subunit [Acidobacteria bacterium]|nr:efflux RND transporter periplasmic adaptor subunit [Acidobacteriota bacterium]
MAALAVVALGAAASYLLWPQVPQVAVARAESSGGAQGASLIATGYIVAHHKIEVGSKVFGKVAWIGVEKGDHVRRGQVVVRLDDQEYRAQVSQARANLLAAQARLDELQAGSRAEEIQQARAQMEAAQARLEQARLDLQRMEALAERGVEARHSLDRARTDYRVAEAELEAARKNFELISKGPRIEQIDRARAELEQAKAALLYTETQLDATRIRAPVEGTILERLVEDGEMVTTGFVGERGAKSFVVSMADLSDLQVELDINQNDFRRIRPAHPATVVPEAYPDRSYRGVVAEIAPEADRQKATVQVKVKVLNPDEKLRPEMNAKVTFLESEAPSDFPGPEVLVPRAAVVKEGSDNFVWVVRDSRVQKLKVEIQERDSQRFAVPQGLAGGETVVVSGQERLKEGTEVRVLSP